MSPFYRLLGAVAAGLLTACASEPVQDRYYSLVLAADDIPVRTTAVTGGAQLLVGPIRVASYLNQPSLAIQKGKQQVQIANHNFWAEPLAEGIAKVLVRDLSNRDLSLRVSRESGRNLAEADCQVRLEFDKFQVTDASTVVARGRYWLTSANRKRGGFQGDFSLERGLTADGYDNAVNELRALLGDLSEQLSETLVQRQSCLAAPASVLPERSLELPAT